jgi:hypothetical protein
VRAFTIIDKESISIIDGVSEDMLTGSRIAVPVATPRCGTGTGNRVVT